MKNRDIYAHVRGESRFIDDLLIPSGTLFAAVYTSTVAHGKILSLNLGRALQKEGIVAVLTAQDIPGENQIGGIIQDEPLLAEDEVHFIGQPIAIVVAKTKEKAREALKLIEVNYKELPPIFCPRQAASNGQLLSPSRTISSGNVKEAFSKSDYVITGTVESGGQEHIYLEMQGAVAIPRDNQTMKVYSSTQAPTAVQRIVARCLGLPMNAIEVDVKRLGGGFGGKEDQATPWAVMAAVAAQKLSAPVKLVLTRTEDMRFTGKRHPYSTDYTIGVMKDGRIMAFQVTFYQNGGAANDLSPAVLERSLFHISGSYFIPNLEVTAYSCRTNLPPFTAFRGFGGPQAFFTIESAIHKAAETLGLPVAQVQKTNLLRENDSFHYGMKVKDCRATRVWEELHEKYNVAQHYDEIDAFNESHPLQKKGIAIMPICFGISFTSTFLNQAGALAHVYTDGSVRISTGAIEMGQNVNRKILMVAAQTMGLSEEYIFIDSTNTSRVANTSPTAASTGADMNGMAAVLACEKIQERLMKFAMKEYNLKSKNLRIKGDFLWNGKKKTDISWKKLVNDAYMNRLNLSAYAHYATPDISYDKKKEQGKPFAYHVYGAALTEVTLDCVRGTYHVDSVKIVHDAGRSLSPKIDRGQVEGALVQGIGWSTIEELLYANGRLVSDTLTTYKVPDIHSVPEIDVLFLENADNPKAVMYSKAVGEPPFMYGIGTYFALLAAMKAYEPRAESIYSIPMTSEKVFIFLHQVEKN